MWHPSTLTHDHPRVRKNQVKFPAVRKLTHKGRRFNTVDALGLFVEYWIFPQQMLGVRGWASRLSVVNPSPYPVYVFTRLLLRPGPELPGAEFPPSGQSTACRSDEFRTSPGRPRAPIPSPGENSPPAPWW